MFFDLRCAPEWGLQCCRSHATRSTFYSNPAAKCWQGRQSHCAGSMGAMLIVCAFPFAGPFFLFLMGKAREWAVGSTLSAVGLRKGLKSQ